MSQEIHSWIEGDSFVAAIPGEKAPRRVPFGDAEAFTEALNAGVSRGIRISEEARRNAQPSSDPSQSPMYGN